MKYNRGNVLLVNALLLSSLAGPLAAQGQFWPQWMANARHSGTTGVAGQGLKRILADIVYDPGKYVQGALFDLNEADMLILDAKVGRKVDTSGKEIGVYKRIEVKVAPLGKGEPVKAVTYQGLSSDRYHIPPTKHYMDSVIQGAYSFGLSMMWVSYLQSFSTQVGKKPKPPGFGDAAPRM